MNDCPDACILLDRKNQVVSINTAAEKLLRLGEAEITGKSLEAVLSERGVVLSADHPPGERSADGYPLPEDPWIGLSETKVSLLLDPAGNFLGRLAIFRAVPSSPRQEMLGNHNEILVALQETTLDLHSSLDVNIVLRNIVERACTLLGTSHGYLVILRESGELEPVVGLGSLAEILKFKIALGKGLAGIVWKTGRPLFVPDYDRWPGRLREFEYGLIHAMLGIPLVLNGQVIGVIGIGRGAKSEASFSEEDIVVLERFASLAVLALQNAKLFEKAQAELEFRRKTEVQLRNANQVLQFQIERIELLQGELEQQALRDSLTNLFNRRYLQESLEVEFARANRSGISLAILMMDCDRLKHINDTYGHKTGDDSLVLIAKVIRESIRAGDIACRYGGDEFVVVLGNVSRETAIERAENLRNRIETEPILHEHGKIQISVSVGIAMFPVHGTFGGILLQKADQALYAAKRKGKNQVQVYSDHL